MKQQQRKNRRRVKLSCWWWAFIGSVIVVTVGSLLHFAYEWSNKSPAIAWLAATNESVWEHQKLLVWPYLMTTLLMYFAGTREYEECCRLVIQRDKRDLWLSRGLGMLVGLLFIPLVFYIYTQGGKEGKSILAVDLLTFVVAAVLGNFIVCAFKFRPTIARSFMGVLINVIVPTLFIVFSYAPPTNTGLFFPYGEE